MQPTWSWGTSRACDPTQEELPLSSEVPTDHQSRLWLRQTSTQGSSDYFRKKTCKLHWALVNLVLTANCFCLIKNNVLYRESAFFHILVE